MTGGFDWDEEEGNKKPAAKKKQESDKASTGVCSKCKEPGHLGPTNKKCKFYKPKVPKKKEEIAEGPVVLDDPEYENTQMADEIDMMDKMPLYDSGESAFYSAASDLVMVVTLSRWSVVFELFSSRPAVFVSVFFNF